MAQIALLGTEDKSLCNNHLMEDRYYNMLKLVYR